MNPEQFFNFRKFGEDFIIRVSHRSNSLLRCPDENCLKTDWRHVLLTDNFFFNTILTVHFILSLQAEFYRNINYYQFYIS